MARRKRKKSGNVWWITALVILFTVAAVGYVWYRSRKIETAGFIRYPAFGIDIPGNYAIHGIDVSRYQSYIDWKLVKNMEVDEIKINFAVIKATEGVRNLDRQFRRNWKKAGEAKMTRGAYHFFLANKSGKLQAKNYISTVKLQPGDMPPVLDIEHLYGTTPAKMQKEIKDWLRIVEDHYGVKPIIYTYATFYTSFLSGEFDDYPLWVAHYFEKKQPRVNRPWIIWQHSERGRVNGIRHAVDFNVFKGDSTAFADLLIK